MAESKFFDFDGSKDPVARLLAILLAALLTFWSTFRSSDRFTAEDGAVLEARIDQLASHVSPEGQAAVHAEINTRIDRLERDINNLPPEWLKEDLKELKRRLEAIERDHNAWHSAHNK